MPHKSLYSFKWIAYTYLKTGDLELADSYIEQELEQLNRVIERSRYPADLIDRAAVLALRGLKEEAFADLK